MTTGTLIAPPEARPISPSVDRRGEYRCECGQVLRVFGGGRHRVYFEPTDTQLDDPVMNRVCPACGRGLPGKNAPDPDPPHRLASRHQKGPLMTHAMCPDCRLRFTPAAAVCLPACPACGEPLQPLAGLAGAMGYRLFRLEDVPRALPEAIEVSMPVPDPESRRP